MTTSRPGTLHIVSVVMFVLAVQVAWPADARAANPLFSVRATGTQVVPATASAGTTDARVTILESAFILVQGTFSGLGGGCTAAHIHLGAPGANGPVVATLPCSTSNGGTLSGVFPPAAGDIDNLRNGRWYVDLHTTEFPDGEIRGQPVPLAAHIANLSGAQVVPTPTGDTARGFAEAALNAAGTALHVTVGYQGLTGGTTGIDLHGEALPGANAPVIATMVPDNTNAVAIFPGLNVPVTPTQGDQFKTGKMYVRVRSAAFPDGAIRGQLKPPNKLFDFDADGRSEIGVFRQTPGVWYVINHATGVVRTEAWGAYTDVPTPADYDGDGKTDLAIWREGVFWINLSSTGGVVVQPWGINIADRMLAPADFDGDGRSDMAIYRRGQLGGNPSYFYILQSATNTARVVHWGQTSDVDISADYDGDSKTDLAIYRTSSGKYYILGSQAGMMVRTWGVFATDYLVPGDYDGDGRTDMAVYRFSGAGTGTWYVLRGSTLTFEATVFGAPSDIPVPADYDGDGKTDKAVIRQSGGAWTWYILRSSTGTMDVRAFGVVGDMVIPVTIIR